MMTTEEAMSYLQESKKTATGTAETETAQTTTETELQPGADGGNGGEGGSPNPAEDGAGTGEDGGNGEGGTPTDQADGKASTPQGGKPDGAGNDTDILEKNKARWAESFRKEKDKRKRQRIQYENQIASLNKQIAELKTKLDGGLDRKSDEGMQTLIDMNVAQRELKRVEDERTQAQIEEDQEENERRVVACFPDEADRNVYRTLVKNSGEALRVCGRRCGLPHTRKEFGRGFRAETLRGGSRQRDSGRPRRLRHLSYRRARTDDETQVP